MITLQVPLSSVGLPWTARASPIFRDDSKGKRWLLWQDLPLTAAGKGLANFSIYSSWAASTFLCPLKMISTAPYQGRKGHCWDFHSGPAHLPLSMYVVADFLGIQPSCRAARTHWTLPGHCTPQEGLERASRAQGQQPRVGTGLPAV